MMYALSSSLVLKDSADRFQWLLSQDLFKSSTTVVQLYCAYALSQKNLVFFVVQGILIHVS